MMSPFYKTLALLGERLDFEHVASAGDMLGRLMWAAVPSRRQLATEAIAFHLGKDQTEARRLAKLSFLNNCRSFLEIFLTRKVDWHFEQDRMSIMPPHKIKELQADSAPAVLATAHFGAWELLAGLLHLYLGHKPANCIVVRKNSNEALNDFMNSMRGRPGVDVLEHRQATRPILKTLRKGGTCAFLVDHNCRRDEAIFLPFLNDIAAVNMGPALLAVRTNATVWPAFLVRKPNGRYMMHMPDPLKTANLTGSTREKVEIVASFYTRAVEDYVRAYPEQWFWMHKRWKTRPE